MAAVPPSEAMNLAYKQHEPEEWEIVNADEEAGGAGLRSMRPEAL